MENAEEVFQFLEEFTKRRPKVIPRELEDYLNFVATTGDPIYQWSLVKNLFKEKLLSVITEFYETSPGLDIPHCPNVDIFSYETMKNNLLEKIDAFPSAPFTIQRICELLTAPRKQYNRIDKFMRAFEKNILVVSTRDPGPPRRAESENGEAAESMVNGSDSNSEYNVDVEMEDISSWKENTENIHGYAVQSGSSATSRTQSESDDVPFSAQNGPAPERSTAARVELMTIEADADATSIAEDLPESSTGDSDLSPPESDAKQSDYSDSDKVSPVSSVITVLPADSVNSPTADSQTEKDFTQSTTSEKLITESESSITTSDSIKNEPKVVQHDSEFEPATSSIEVDDNNVQETDDKENTSPSPPTAPSPDIDDDKCSDSEQVTESNHAEREIEPNQLPDTSSDRAPILREDSVNTENLVSDSEIVEDDSTSKVKMESSEVTPSPELSIVTTTDEIVSETSDKFIEESSDSKIVDSTEQFPTASPGEAEDIKCVDTLSRESDSPESVSIPMVETSSAPVESSTGVIENLPESTSDDSNNDSEMSSTDDSNSTVVSNSYTALADPVESMTEDVEATLDISNSNSVSNSTAVSNSSPIPIINDPTVTDSAETTCSLSDKSESSSPSAPIVSSQTDDVTDS